MRRVGMAFISKSHLHLLQSKKKKKNSRRTFDWYRKKILIKIISLNFFSDSQIQNLISKSITSITLMSSTKCYIFFTKQGNIQSHKNKAKQSRAKDDRKLFTKKTKIFWKLKMRARTSFTLVIRMLILNEIDLKNENKNTKPTTTFQRAH